MNRLLGLSLLVMAAMPIVSLAEEGFALGITGAMSATNPGGVTEASGLMQNNSTQTDASLHELVAQPAERETAGVKNPLVVEPKKPWTQAQREQYAAMLENNGVYTAGCTKQVVDTLAQYGTFLTCGTWTPPKNEGGGGVN